MGSSVVGLEGFLRELEERGIEYSVDEWVRAAYSRDYWPLLVAGEAAGRRPTLPGAVVRPRSGEEVVAVLEAAYRHRAPLIPYSGGSGVLGGAAPLSGREAVLDLSRLNRYRWHDRDSMIVYAEAGAYLWEVEEWLNRQGYSLRHYPQSYPEAMIGGLVSTRSSGQYSTLYGSIEDIVVGLEVAVPGYGLLKLPPSPRRAVGPRLEELFIGGEGVFGVVVAAYLGARPLPRSVYKGAFLFPSFREAMAFSKHVVQRSVPVAVLRVYDEAETSIHFGRVVGEWGSLALVLVEHSVEGVAASAWRAVEEAALDKRGRSLGTGPVEHWLSTRFAVTRDIAKLRGYGLWFDTVEVTLPWSTGLQAYTAMRDKLSRVEGVVSFTAHASHFYPWGYCLYTTVVFDATRGYDALVRAYMEAWETILVEARRAGGSISHHHNIGLHRAKWLGLELGGNGVALLERLRRAVDPECLLNPGKLVGCE